MNLKCTPECWLTIPQYPKYQASNLGNIRNAKKLQVLKPYLTNRGYHTVGFWVDGKKKRLSVHRLVSMTFLPNREELPEVNHINGCKTDNQLTNLEWASGSSNVIHTYRTGLHQTKLNPEMVLKISEYRKLGKSLREVGRLLDVSHSTVWEIEQGKIYKDIA